MKTVIFINADGSEDEQKITYPEDLLIIGEGYSFWGYTPYDRFVVPMNGRIEIQ